MVIPALVEYMEKECGIRMEDLVILVANGTHLGGDEAELRTLVTDAVYDRVKVVNQTAWPMTLCIWAPPAGAPRWW